MVAFFVFKNFECSGIYTRVIPDHILSWCCSPSDNRDKLFDSNYRKVIKIRKLYETSFTACIYDTQIHVFPNK